MLRTAFYSYSRPRSRRFPGSPGSRCHSCSAGPFLRTDRRHQENQEQPAVAAGIGAEPVLTLQGVPGEAQLADDVTGDVGLDALALLGMALRCFQQVVELLGVKLLQEAGRKGEMNAASDWPTGLLVIYLTDIRLLPSDWTRNHDLVNNRATSSNKHTGSPAAFCGVQLLEKLTNQDEAFPRKPHANTHI